MKAKLLLLALGFFCSTQLSAIEREIYLQKTEPDEDHKDEWVKDNRSLTLEATAIIDGDILRVYTNLSVDNVEISFVDAQGNNLYQSSDASSSTCHIFNIAGLPQGEHLVYIGIGDTLYYGYVTAFLRKINCIQK